MSRKRTVMIEDSSRIEYRRRLDEVLNRYSNDQIFNIDTGMVHDGYDSAGNPRLIYYAFIIVTDSENES